MSWSNINSEEAEDEIQGFDPFAGREGVIWLIDFNSDMFKPTVKGSLYNEESEDRDDDDDKETFIPIRLALECCKQSMLSKIRNLINSFISIIFFGTEQSDGTRKHIIEYQSLAVSNKSKIKQLDEILDDIDKFKQRYGHAKESHLADGLSACLSSFNACSSKLGHKRVLLFTTNSNPDEAFPDRQHKIRKRAEDLTLAKVSFKVIPLNPEFEDDLFYKEIMEIINKNDSEIPEPLDDEEDVLNAINKENHNKRTLARVKFNLGHGVNIGIAFYRFTRKVRYLKKMKLSRENNEQLRPVREHLHADTGSKLRPYEISKTTTVGGMKVSFTKEHYLKMRKQFEPGVTLLGFKPKSAWKVEYFCSRPFFVYPDETIVKGSTTLFTALLRRCLARNVVAVCALVLRRASRPRYVFLVPQEEVQDSKGMQVKPSGFHVYHLPFARMLGDMPKIEGVGPSNNEDLTLVMRKIVKKIRIKHYVSDYFENPALNKKWNYLEAIALGYEQPREFTDTTMVHFNKAASRLKDLAEEYNEIFIQSHSLKRKADGSGGSGGSSKRKAGGSNTSVEIPEKSELTELISEKQVNRLKVDQLKEILKCVPNISVSKKNKSDLCALIYSHEDVIRKAKLID